MPKPKKLSGDDIVRIFAQFGFETVSQKGSHIKLVRGTATGAREILTIPNHKEIRKGTVKAILNQASRYIPQQELRPHFYS
jgi:predicted RNA binding protein YcfA (HicA-like mRNA interferase family)